MPSRVQLSPEHPVIEIRYAGRLSRLELTQSIDEALLLSKESGRVLVLTDCQELAGGHSITDLFYLADRIKELALNHRYREAVIVPELPATAGFAEFWETTCKNRGLTVKLFHDRDAALGWLLQKPSPEFLER